MEEGGDADEAEGRREGNAGMLVPRTTGSGTPGKGVSKVQLRQCGGLDEAWGDLKYRSAPLTRHGTCTSAHLISSRLARATKGGDSLTLPLGVHPVSCRGVAAGDGATLC